MKACVVTFKECWRDPAGQWYSFGGFPLQMTALSRLFDQMTLLSVEVTPRAGGIPFGRAIRVIPVRPLRGSDNRRKLSLLAQLPYYLAEIASAIRDADTVHTPLPGDLSLLGMLVALLMRKHLIARYGGSWEETDRTTFMNRITKTLMKRFAGGRNVMLATGLGRQPPAPQLHWVYVTAISECEVANVLPDLDREIHNPLQLAYVGRLSPEKGVIYILQALGLLRRSGKAPGSSLKLSLFGDGPQRAELEATARAEGIEDWVEFAGQVGREVLVQRLIKTDVCVLPSLTESFCKARLDAMLCGVPVVTTGVGFGREIIGQDGERGWLAAPASADDLANIIEHILKVELDWRSLRQRCRKYVEETTLEAWAQQIGEICARQWGISLVEGKLIG